MPPLFAAPRPSYRGGMDEEQQPRERHPGVWLAGAVALGAWFAMLWFMFGDVI
jgi:hypothetical protein